MLTVKQFHDKYWLPLSIVMNKAFKKYKYVYLAKKLFDIHFKILGVLGIFATPKDELDCYVFMLQRSKDPRWGNLKFRERLIKAWKIFKEELKNV